MKRKEETRPCAKIDHCHYSWYSDRTVPAGGDLQDRCNFIRIIQQLPEIRHSTDDPGLCDYGNCRSVSGGRKTSADHRSACIRFYTDRRYCIVPGIYQSVSKLHECRCTGSDRCNCRCIFKPVLFYFSAGNPGYAVCCSTGIYPGTLVCLP